MCRSIYIADREEKGGFARETKECGMGWHLCTPAFALQLLSTLDHPFIVRYLDSYIEGQNLHIVMNFCDGKAFGVSV